MHIPSMFTGIIQALVEVKKVENKPGLKYFVLDFPKNIIDGLKIGASVSINGACHTVAEINGGNVAFDAMEETLKKTNIVDLKVGDKVNVERSAKMGDEIGGHIMSGHILNTVSIVNIEKSENNKLVTFKTDPKYMKYILHKGFLGLDGCSLTIVNPDKEKGEFKVWLIPETLRITTFGFKKEGDVVNLEIDSRTQAIIDTVEEIMKTTK